MTTGKDINVKVGLSITYLQRVRENHTQASKDSCTLSQKLNIGLCEQQTGVCSWFI
jgi:hypothetical protein